MTETAHGTEFCQRNQTLLTGPLLRKLRWFESMRDGLPHAASHHHLAQGARELMAEEVSLRFLGFTDPRVAPLSGFVPGGSVSALERRWVAIGVADRMPRRRAPREQPSLEDRLCLLSLSSLTCSRSKLGSMQAASDSEDTFFRAVRSERILSDSRALPAASGMDATTALSSSLCHSKQPRNSAAEDSSDAPGMALRKSMPKKK
jgi:hypothetical protein